MHHREFGSAMAEAEPLRPDEGTALDQYTPEAALDDDPACSSDDEESVDVCLGGAPADAPDAAKAAQAASDPMAGSKTGDDLETPVAAVPASLAAEAEVEASTAPPQREAAASQQEASGSSAAASTLSDAHDMHDGHSTSVTCQAAGTAAAAAAAVLSDAVPRTNERSAQIQRSEDQQALDSSRLHCQSESTLATSPATQPAAAGTAPNRQPVDKPAVHNSSLAEQQAPASDVKAFVQNSGSSETVSHDGEGQMGGHEKTHAEAAVASAAAKHNLPTPRTSSADSQPETGAPSPPRSSLPQQGLPGLRERESQPYHILPAVPERLSIGQRPSAAHPQPPRPGGPVHAAQTSGKGNRSSRERGVLAEELATQKLQEAQRLRDLERQQLREQLEHEQATGKAQYTVLAHCALRAGAGADTECQAGSKQREILENQSHIYFACSEGCKMAYHHPVCYHCLVDALRHQRPSFKGFKGKEALPCLTDMCSGILIEATLYKVSNDGRAEPPVAWIQRPKPRKHPASLQAESTSSQHDSKRGKFSREIGRRESGEHNGPAAPSQDQQQDQQQQHRIEPERQINTAQPPSPKQPVHLPLPEELDGLLRPYKREEVPDKLTVPRHKQQATHDPQQESIATQQARLERQKKATMHMRLDQFVGEQAEQLSEDYSLDGQQHSWGRQAGRGQQQVHFPLPPASSGNGAALATLTFPSLQQAVQGGAEASESAMVVLAALRQMQQDQQWGVPTNTLLLECLDVAGVAEEMGCADMDAALDDQLHAVFDSYGDIERLRTFSDQEAAAVQFSDAGAAARARVHEDRRQMGRKPMRISHLTRFPTDSAIDEVIRAQLEAAEEARAEAPHPAGHLPSRGQRTAAWDIESNLGHGGSLGHDAAYLTHATGSLNVQAPEFRPSTPLDAVVNAPEFVPGSTWRSGSLESNGVTVPSSQPKVPGGKAVPQLEEPSRPQPSSSAAAPAWREEDALALVAQMERDEEMARALAAQDSALARQLQEQDDERLAREMAGGGSGLSLPHPALPPRSETWAAGRQPSTAFPVSPPQPVSPPLADDPDSPVGPDAWGLEDDVGGGVPAGLQPDAAFADAWNDSGSTLHPDATSTPNEWATSKAAPVASTAARGGNSSPQGSQSSGTTHAFARGAAGVEDLRFQPVLAQEEDADDDDPFGWMMESGGGGGSEAGASAAGKAAAPVSTAGAAYGAAAKSSSSTPKHKAYNPISAGAS